MKPRSRCLSRPLAVAAGAMAYLVVGVTWATEGQRGPLEEVVVTAQKRTESVADVPMAMSVLGADELAYKGIRSAQDLQIEIPSLRSGTHAGTTQVSIRGIGLGLFYGPAQPGVAQYIDGAYLPRATSGNLIQTDLERIEVLKGPQGTLYGRNSTGGAINYITRAPAEQFEGEFSAGYGSYDEWRASGVLSGPVSERLSVRGAVSAIDRNDGQMDRVLEGDSDAEVDPMKDVSGRLRATYLASDRVTIDTTMYYSAAEGGTYLQNTTPFSAGAIAAQPILATAVNSIKPFKIGQDPGRYEKDNYGAIVTVTGDVSDTMSIKSVSAASWAEMALTVDIDAAEIPFVPGAHEDDSTFLSQELSVSQMTGNYSWMAGLYFSLDDLEGRFWDDFPLGFNGGSYRLIDDGRLTFRWDTKMTSYAAFFDGTYQLSEAIELFGGVRYSIDDYEMETFNTMTNVSFGGGPVLPVAVLCGPEEFDREFKELSSRLGVRYSLDDEQSVYGSWSTGYKPGGFEFTACGDEFDKETIQSFEIGYKGSLADGLVGLNAAAFYYDYSDYQLYSTEGLAALTSNADSAEVYGVELDWNISASDRVTFTGAASWLHARWEEFSNYDPLNPDMGIQDVEGKSLPFSPDWTANIGIEYLLPIASADALLRAEYYVTDDYNLREFGSDLDAQDDFGMVNAYIDVAFNDQYRLRIWGKNLTDENYITTMNSHGLTGTRAVTWGDRRMVGIDLTVTM